MSTVRQSLKWMAAVPIVLALAASGCATKKYVRQQVNPVNQKVAALEQKTNDQVSYLNNKIDQQMSQVNERISTTDQKLSEVAAATQQAQGTASRAMEEADANSTKIDAASNAVSTLASNTANALNYQLVESGDVTFATGKSTLTPEAMAALDQIVAKAQGMPRVVIELAGFTDRTGSAAYNLALSRRRAWAVQKYLVGKKIPVRSIYIVGLGKEAPPPELVGILATVDPNASKREVNRMARRVHIRLFGAGDITQSSTGTSQQ